jgi:PAS domain S-box-containing protein
MFGTRTQQTGRDHGAHLNGVHHSEAGHRALDAVLRHLTGSGSLEERLFRSLPEILRAVDFPAGLVRALDASTGRLYTIAHYGFPPAWHSLAAPAELGEHPCGLSARDGAGVVIPDLAAGPDPDSDWACAGYRTYLSEPLHQGDHLLGCLSVAATEIVEPEPWQLELLRSLAQPIAMAVAGSHQYGAAQRKIKYLSALHQCSRDIGPAPSLDRVAWLTAERMAKLLGFERTLLLLRDRGRGEMVGAAAHGFSVRNAQTVVTKFTAELSALTEHGLLVTGDAAADGWLPAEFTARHQIGPALVVPLRTQDETAALLVCDRGDAPIHLSTEEMELALTFANQAAVWLESARSLVRERTARAEAEAAQAEFETLYEMAPDAIVTVGRDGKILLLNSQAERMFGYRREELAGQPIEKLMPERYRTGHVSHRLGYHKDPRTRPMGSGLELLALRSSGEEFPVEISLAQSGENGHASVIAVIRDTTERAEAERERQRLLASEQLKGEQLKLAIREAHHRIKNNLQSISDLLYLELAGLDDAAAAAVVKESLERIQSIALVHDLLTQDEDVQTVDGRVMLERLVPMVLRNDGPGARNAQLEIDAASVPLSSRKATSLALLTSELISNAGKHGLGGEKPRVKVSLQPANDGLLLTVEDNGPGLPRNFDLFRDANVGLQVVRTLAERDLNGKLSLSSGPGLRAEVWFPW